MKTRNVGLKFYSKKRFFIASLSTGAVAGIITSKLHLTYEYNVVLSIFAGAIASLFVNAIFMPKVWLYRIRQLFGAVKGED